MNGTSTLSSPTKSGIAPNFIANRTESRIQANNKTILTLDIEAQLEVNANSQSSGVTLTHSTDNVTHFVAWPIHNYTFLHRTRSQTQFLQNRLSSWDQTSGQSILVKKRGHLRMRPYRSYFSVLQSKQLNYNPLPVHGQAVQTNCSVNCCPRTTTLRRSSGGVGWFNFLEPKPSLQLIAS